MKRPEPPTRNWPLVISIVTLVLCLGYLAYTLYRQFVVLPAALPASRATRRLANADVNPYGANFFLAKEVEDWKKEKTLQMAKAAGVTWIKQQFSWEEIEPRQGQYWDERQRVSTWEKHDKIVALAEKYGMQIVARLDRPPDWTRQDNRFKERPPDDLKTYGDFIYTFVKHYQGRIQYVQIWNEPNIWPEWGDRPVDPAGYTALLKVAYQRAKEADPNVYVLNAPLAITLGEPGNRSMNELDYMRDMYKAGARGYFDIMSANAFGLEFPPEDPPSPTRLNFRRVELLRQIMVDNNDAAKAVWFNEFGWNASPASMPESALVWRRVTEDQQAEYTARAIEMAREKWDWAGVFMVWYFRQVGDILPSRSDFFFRMVDVDFTPRPVYHTVKNAALKVQIEAAAPGHHEETSPHVLADPGWRGIIEPQAAAGRYMSPKQANTALNFTFEGDWVALVTRVGPGAGSFWVSLDGRNVDGLPRDPDGRSYVDLEAPALRWQAVAPVAENLTMGRHVLRMIPRTGLQVTGIPGPVLDGFEVGVKDGLPFPYLTVGLLMLGAALAAAATGYFAGRDQRAPSTHLASNAPTDAPKGPKGRPN